MRAALGGFADLLVELLLLPFRNPLRFALGEVAAHRERRIGQVQRVFVVSHGGRSLLEMVLGGFGVEGNLCLQRIEIWKTRLVTNLVHEAYIEMGTVDVARKVEQVELKERTGLPGWRSA